MYVFLIVNASYPEYSIKRMRLFQTRSVHERLEHLEHHVIRLGEHMATLQVDVDRLNAANTALQTFIQQVKDYVAQHGDTIDTSALEAAIGSIEGTISSGNTALSSTPPPVVVNPPTA